MRFRALTAVEEAVRRYPEDPLPWYVLGEVRNHEAWPIGQPPAAVVDAFARAITLDPGFAPPYEHMPGQLLALGRVDEARRYAATYAALDSTSPNITETRLVALLLDPSPARRAEAERLLDTASVHAVWGAVFNSLASWPDTAETAIRLVRRVRDPGRRAGGDAPFVLDTVMWPQPLAHALAFRGHLHEAFSVDERLLRDPTASIWSPFLDPFVDLSLLGVVPDSLARATFGRSLTVETDWGGEFTPRHLRGLPWWLSRRDTTSLARFSALALQVAARHDSPRTTLRARLLGETSIAFLALSRGDSGEALQRLSAIPDTLCLADNSTAHCLHLNLTLARLMAARGDDQRAAELLDRWRWSVGSTPLFVLATLELGRVAERLGDRAKASECYSYVAAVWRRPDRELLPYVAEAREGLTRLDVE